MLGGHSPLGGDGLSLGAVLEEGLNLEMGPVLLRQLEEGEMEASEMEDEGGGGGGEEIALAPRLTTQERSCALRIDWARGSDTREQALEAQVPGAEAELFSLLERRGAPRPQLREGALLANMRLRRDAAATARPRLRETEAYRVWDVATSWWHAEQTRHVRSGRLAFVRQPHGHVSLMLVGRVGGSWAPSHEITILVRGT